jgi:hypothetical protein
LNRWRRIALVAAIGIIGTAILAGTQLVGPKGASQGIRCCLTWANAKEWSRSGFYPNKTPEWIETLIWQECAEIDCQEQWPGGCPSQYGVTQVAAHLKLPPYQNANRWDWGRAIWWAGQGHEIIFFWTGPDYTGPDGLMHAYNCDKLVDGRFHCYDALNTCGKWWSTKDVLTHWSGWATSFGTTGNPERWYMPLWPISNQAKAKRARGRR